MRKIPLVAIKVIPVLATIGLLTACGARGTSETASTADYDPEIAANAEIQDLGTEEYLITETSSAATDEEKQLKYMLYLQEILSREIAKAYPLVRDADVKIVTDSDTTIANTEEVMQVNILLELEEELAEDSIAEIAEAAATAVGSETDDITIVDTDGNVLYIRSEALPENGI